MYVLIYSSEGTWSQELDKRFNQLNIHDFYAKVNEDDYLYKSNKEEYYLNDISESLDNNFYKNVQAIIIDKSLGGSGWTRAIGLAGHIACSKYSNCNLNELPIILTDRSDLDLEDSSLKDTLINNFFQTQGFYYRNYENVFSIKTDIITGLTQYAIDCEIQRLKHIDINKIGINYISDDSHQNANEWGAMRLASNFGIFESINFTYPKHLYFKYISNFIKRDFALQDKSLNNMFNKILLIDDNANCGWVNLLKIIHNCPIDKRVSTEEILAWEYAAPEKFEQYDLIYLDLYLDKSKSDSASALMALKFIKKNFPHIPVIIFTASNKAWNLDEVLENGADAMYIKESPLYYRNVNYSTKNFNDFKNTVKYVYEKYKILRPYWLLIKKITCHSKFKSIENSPRLLKDRIEERLKMFYGLLKKGYEQWDYDKQTFFYSDYELAFMTLWSVLNEIQEVSYEKRNISITHTDGKIYHHHPDRNKTPLSRKQKWILKSNNKIFIENRISFSGSQIDGRPKVKSSFRYDLQNDKATSDLNFDRRTSPYYSIDSTFSENDFILKSLHAQIAYILLNRSPCNTIQLENLFRLGEIRNSMYLTHGDSFCDNFYDKTEKSKRTDSTVTPEKDIKDLFDLVAFLLTDDTTYCITL